MKLSVLGGILILGIIRNLINNYNEEEEDKIPFNGFT